MKYPVLFMELEARYTDLYTDGIPQCGLCPLTIQDTSWDVGLPVSAQSTLGRNQQSNIS